MFGCGLPVLAARYDVIHELVREDARFAGGSVRLGARGKPPVVRLPNVAQLAPAQLWFAGEPNGCLFGGAGSSPRSCAGCSRVHRGYQRGGGDAGEDAARVGGEGRGEQVEG